MNLSPTVWPRLSKLLDEALDMAPDARQRWLEQLATTQPQLAPSLRELLAAHASSETDDVMARLPPLAARARMARTAVLAPGDRVGPYRLKRELGAGGMADVWLAERADGAFARDVALKLPLISRLRRDLAQRFARERDILARLEHPNIARLYDAGVTEDGLPYLAMEYVDGQPIIEYCDQHRLDIESRLKLFANVFDAAQFAHANLIIHRDLKPSNILVTADAQVRLLDFGIAKLLTDDDTARETQLTQLSGRALTPNYASPEQIKGEPLTIATDIYSLGVVLYELLSGVRPYKLRVQSTASLEQAILDVEPKRPSGVVDSAAATSRATSRSRLSRALTGDLDTIVLKALAKAPQRRYATVAGFAADLKRYQDGQPVTARPAAWTYRMRKFVARNKLVVGAATMTGFALVAGAGIALWQTHEARADQRRAEQVKGFLASIFADIDPRVGQGSRVPASAILLRARTRIDKEFGADTRLALEVATLVANALIETQESRAGAELIQSALQHYGSRLPRTAPQVLRARTSDLRAHGAAGTLRTVAHQIPDLIGQLRADPSLSEELVFALMARSKAESTTHPTPDAMLAASEAAAIAHDRFGEQHKVTIEALNSWSNLLLGAEQPHEALAAAKRAAGAAQAVYQRPHPSLSDVEQQLALVLERLGKPRDAAVMQRRVVDDARTIYGENTMPVAAAQFDLGVAMVMSGQLEGGLENLRDGQETTAQLSPDDRVDNLMRRTILANAYLVARQPSRALEKLDEAERAALAAGETIEPYTYLRLTRCAALMRAGRPAEAAAQYAPLAPAVAKFPPLERWRAHRFAALFARLQDRLVDAETSARAALAVSETLSSGVTLRALARADLGLALLEKGELDEAERALQTSRLELEEAQGGVTPDRLDVELGLARISYLRGRKPELMPSLDPAAQSWPASGAQTLDGHAFEYWRAKVNGVSPAVPTLAALRSSPYPLHRKWLAN